MSFNSVEGFIRDVIVVVVSPLNGKIVLLKFDIDVREYQLVFHLLPKNGCHFITFKLDNRVLDNNFIALLASNLLCLELVDAGK